MKLLLVLTSIFYAGCFPGRPDCKSLRTGRFKLIFLNGITIIERRLDEQTETDIKRDIKVVYKIRWVNDCIYQLFNSKVYKGGQIYKMKENDTMTVSIVEVNKKNYTVVTTSNFSDLKDEENLQILK